MIRYVIVAISCGLVVVGCVNDRTLEAPRDNGSTVYSVRDLDHKNLSARAPALAAADPMGELIASVDPHMEQYQEMPVKSSLSGLLEQVDRVSDHTLALQQEPAACPEGMVLVMGQYCPKVEQTCIRWLETEGPYAYFRCAEYKRPGKCLAERRSMRFCMDRDEYVPPGETLPASHQSWTDATRVCASLGKRVCMESEWNFACEGEELRPYPYGFVRDAQACNADKVDIFRANGKLKDLRSGAQDYPDCTSPFGVHHLSGNLEEWTTIDGSVPARPAMKGAYWQPSRNHCRAAQTAHDTYYNGDETGFRCCRDAD